MSRHRDVRCMNYSDEYDGYDDVYGHSVEDEYCVSPNTEQFMFDRNKQPNIASFFTEPDIEEDEEEVEEVPSSYKVPELSELDAAKLMSCAEAIKNVIGDTYPESELNKKIIESNYNSESALNVILLEQDSANQKEKTMPTKESSAAKPDLKLKHNFVIPKFSPNFSKSSFKNDDKSNSTVSKGMNSLFDLISSSTKLLPSNSTSVSNFNSLADLTAHHLNISNPKEKIIIEQNKKVTSPLGLVIPKFLNKKENENLKKNDASKEIKLDIPELKIENKEDINKIVQLDDSCNLLMHKVLNIKLEDDNRIINDNLKIKDKEMKDCILYSNNENQFHKFPIKSVSLFGKILCKKWRRCSSYRKGKNLKKSIITNNIKRFDFSSLSPDSIILTRILKCQKLQKNI